MSTTIPDYREVLEEGKDLFAKIADDLSIYSKMFIHPPTKRTHRREQDYKEICIALALFKRHLEEKDGSDVK